MIFYDLTDAPYGGTGDEARGEWSFIKEVLSEALDSLETDGHLMTHCNGISVPEVLNDYEDMARGLNEGKVDLFRWESFVPSFMETWVFYQIKKHTA